MVRLISLFDYLGFQKRESCSANLHGIKTNKRLMTAVTLSLSQSSRTLDW